MNGLRGRVAAIDVPEFGPGVSDRLGGLLRRAGIRIAGREDVADVQVVSHGRERQARALRPAAPVVALTRRPDEVERALADGAADALSHPVDERRFLESVNRVLLVTDRVRLVANLLGVRRQLRRIEARRDPVRALEFLRWAPKVRDLGEIDAKLPPRGAPVVDFVDRVATGVRARAGQDLLDDLLPLSIDLEFERTARIEERPSPESFAGPDYYGHLLDAKLRLEEILDWHPVREGLGLRARAAEWIRTPQLDRLAVEATRTARLPDLDDAALGRLVRDLRHFHAELRGAGY